MDTKQTVAALLPQIADAVTAIEFIDADGTIWQLASDSGDGWIEPFRWTLSYGRMQWESRDGWVRIAWLAMPGALVTLEGSPRTEHLRMGTLGAALAAAAGDTGAIIEEVESKLRHRYDATGEIVSMVQEVRPDGSVVPARGTDGQWHTLIAMPLNVAARIIMEP